MTKNEIVGRLKAGGLDASSTNRNAAVYVADAMAGRSEPGWFAYRLVCDSETTERRVRAILSRWYDIDFNGNGVWRLRSKNQVPLMAIKRGWTPPTPPTPTKNPMYLEAVEANSTVSLISTLATAPNLEYSTDGVTWQEWQHTTADGTHTFDTITLDDVGEKVYFRGDNPDGLADFDNDLYSKFLLNGLIKAGGNVMSLLDTTMELTNVPYGGFYQLFFYDSHGGEPTPLLTAPDMSTITSISIGACAGMYELCILLNSAASMPALITIGEDGCAGMYAECTFDMSDDGTTLNFAFPTPPVTAGEATYSTAYDIAEWMGNTNGFTNP